MLILVLSLAAAIGPTAPPHDSLRVGLRVRIQAPQAFGSPVARTGLTTDVTPTGLRLWVDGAAAPTAVAFEQIRRLEVSAGTRTGARRGALIGALPWLFFSAGVVLSGGWAESGVFSKNSFAILASFAGTGAAIGNTIKYEAWREVPVLLPADADAADITVVLRRVKDEFAPRLR